MSEYIPINLTYYDPRDPFFRSGRDDRETFTLYSCNNSENCKALKENRCVMMNHLCGQGCPYGMARCEVGYTKRSKKCGALIDNAKERYSDVRKRLGDVKSLSVIGDYVFLGLPYLQNYVNPIRSREFFYSDSLIEKVKLTPEFVVELINYNPKAVVGGVIPDYQKKYVPEFVRSLRKKMPELYAEVEKIYPDVAEIGNLKEMNFVKRKAYVKTLNPGKVKFSIHVVDWDGEHITFKGDELTFSELNDAKFVVTPGDKTWVTIVDNATVTEDTVFCD